MQKINLKFDIGPLKNLHSTRGIGTYTRQLYWQLKKNEKINIVNNTNQKPDIVHFPYFDFFKPTLPIFTKVKKVVTIHDVIPLIYKQYNKPGKRGKLSFLYQKIALKFTDAIITDSYNSKSDIVKYLKIPPEKIHVVYLASPVGIDASFLDQKFLMHIRKKYKLPKKYFLYVGDINFNKNVPQLIKMMRFLDKDIHLICVGKNFTPQDIPEYKMIENQIEMSQVSDRVKFITSVSPDAKKDLTAIYHMSIAYVQPSLYEGFGLPVLEAMKSKTIVISSNTSSLIEIGGNNVFYSDPDAESFAKVALKVLSLPKTLRDELIEKSYEWANSFSWEKTAQNTIKVYEKVLSKS